MRYGERKRKRELRSSNPINNVSTAKAPAATSAASINTTIKRIKRTPKIIEQSHADANLSTMRLKRFPLYRADWHLYRQVPRTPGSRECELNVKEFRPA